MMNTFEYAGMDTLLAGSFRAAIYCRLSKDDDLDGTSASIENQRDMLEKFCQKQGWEVAAVYQDEGITVSKYRILCRKVIEFEIKGKGVKETFFQMISLFCESNL